MPLAQSEVSRVDACLALTKRVFVLELGSHVGAGYNQSWCVLINKMGVIFQFGGGYCPAYGTLFRGWMTTSMTGQRQPASDKNIG